MISTPSCEIREPSGPIENGTTYIVRPRIEPSNSPRNLARMSDGSDQLFVGPASISRCEQMNVRSSTRATSLGLERARNEFGRIFGFSWIIVPEATINLVRRCHSSSEPSHHSTRSGLASWAISSTHSSNCLFLVGGFSRPGMVINGSKFEAKHGHWWWVHHDALRATLLTIKPLKITVVTNYTGLGPGLIRGG